MDGESKERRAHRIKIIKLVEPGGPETKGGELWACTKCGHRRCVSHGRWWNTHPHLKEGSRATSFPKAFLDWLPHVKAFTFGTRRGKTFREVYHGRRLQSVDQTTGVCVARAEEFQEYVQINVEKHAKES